MLLRAVITLQTLVLFSAPITAGLLLSSSGGRGVRAFRRTGCSPWRCCTWSPRSWCGGRLAGSPRPILYAAVFMGLTLAQIALGIAHVKTLHVPLGVLMFGMSVLQLSRVWTDHRAQVAAAGRRGGDVHAVPAHVDHL